MKSLFKISVLFCFLCMINACTAPVDIKTDDAEPRLAIFGYVTNQKGPHSIRISSTNGYFSTERPPVISGAVVSISYDDKTIILSENYDERGVYRTDDEFQGEEGKTYTLDIKLDYNGDGVPEHYRAVATMPYTTRVDSVKLEPSVLPFMPNLLLYGYVPEIQENNLALYLIKNSEKKTVLEYFLIIPDWYFKGSEINGYEFPCVLKDGILAGDTVTFRVASFAEDFSEFISHAKSEAGGSNPLFGGPPADVKSNIAALDPDNEISVAGYFGAFPISEKFTISERNYQ